MLATINFKPRVLFPEINQDIWRPNDVDEYQNLIYQLVRRYSVEKPIVTHWEHANEGDIGWWGGCPFHFGSLEEFVRVLPHANQTHSGSLPAGQSGRSLPGHGYRRCRDLWNCADGNGTQLDFVSYHCYNSDLEAYRRQAKELSRFN